MINKEEYILEGLNNRTKTWIELGKADFPHISWGMIEDNKKFNVFRIRSLLTKEVLAEAVVNVQKS